MMNRLAKIILLLLIFSHTLIAQEQMSFLSLDSLLRYAEKNSMSIKTGEQQVLLAKWQKISAQAGILNFRMQSNINLTNNVELPVSFLPAEAFGGAPGTFKEVTMGQQFIGNINIAPQIDLINPASWAKLASAKVNNQLAEVNCKLAKKSLFESISASYHNILSLQEQITLTEKSLMVADTLLFQMQHKHREGIVRLQDLNDAKINRLSLVDKLQQLILSKEQQYLSLKILCDIPESIHVTLDEPINYSQHFNLNTRVDNQLSVESAKLKAELSNADLNTQRLMNLPTLSLVFYDAWQQNSNIEFFNPNAQWLNSQYVGLKLTLPFPDFNKLSQVKSSKINRTISLQNATHSRVQNENANQQLVLDYEKAFSQFRTAQEISEIKSQNYELAFNQFNAGILPSDRLLVSFNDKIASRLNYSLALANLLFIKTKIDINNSIQ